ncbi:hypothetical protein LEP1GSC021_4594 [Leptospira noguchii str. 1993005606]|uniref:Uncharacterized protein n=3 Tax=Leptospira noguchii TaxID=28182 RepID=M6YJD2_9LEPT|nr:hypothetical protein [Leptospira noguchii]EMM98599.1 hypothetical protein LEP1GSC035_1366 [Leptospira noguchii str. 2007001578]EMO53419.1 hypothetical protein LEP1GSC172_1733 [Leptospira noguchii]EMO89719.1 hypothetical protein LEP1GSC024_1219 [Leptospira noguchii str. 2001034031]EPE82258.1 hypothetical protein LEP1GSC021_4594 [Leptospira noguchii str. 1993005606]
MRLKEPECELFFLKRKFQTFGNVEIKIEKNLYCVQLNVLDPDSIFEDRIYKKGETTLAKPCSVKIKGKRRELIFRKCGINEISFSYEKDDTGSIVRLEILSFSIAFIRTLKIHSDRHLLTWKKGFIFPRRTDLKNGGWERNQIYLKNIDSQLRLMKSLSKKSVYLDVLAKGKKGWSCHSIEKIGFLWSFLIGSRVEIIRSEYQYKNLTIAFHYKIVESNVSRPIPINPNTVESLFNNLTKGYWDLDYKGFAVTGIFDSLAFLESGMLWSVNQLGFALLEYLLSEHKRQVSESTLLPQELFQRVKEVVKNELKKLLKEYPNEKSNINIIENKINNSNRQSFDQDLHALLTYYKLELTKDELLEIKRRNNFVHGSAFFKKSGFPHAYKSAEKNQNALVLVLRKILLKMLGYSGPIFKTSELGHPIVKI